MNKSTNIMGNVQPQNLPVPSITISDKVLSQFNEVCERNVCAPKAVAEVIAQTYSLKETDALLQWMMENKNEQVYCPGEGMLPMLEAVPACAQGVKRLEHAIQYLYHHGMIMNLLAIEKAHQANIKSA